MPILEPFQPTEDDRRWLAAIEADLEDADPQIWIRLQHFKQCLREHEELEATKQSAAEHKSRSSFWRFNSLLLLAFFTALAIKGSTTFDAVFLIAMAMLTGCGLFVCASLLRKQ